MFQSLDFENLGAAGVFHYIFDIGSYIDVLFSVNILVDGSGALFVFLFLCHNEAVSEVSFQEAVGLFLQVAVSYSAVPECISDFLLCQTCWIFDIPSVCLSSRIAFVRVLVHTLYLSLRRSM